MESFRLDHGRGSLSENALLGREVGLLVEVEDHVWSGYGCENVVVEEDEVEVVEVVEAKMAKFLLGLHLLSSYTLGSGQAGLR